MPLKTQLSFAAGETDPAIYGRPDQIRYQTGCAVLRNFKIRKSGGIENRPGTVFVGEIKTSSKAAKLIPFVYSDDQTYMIEAGHQSMRFIHSQAYVTLTAVTITGVTKEWILHGEEQPAADPSVNERLDRIEQAQERTTAELQEQAALLRELIAQLRQGDPEDRASSGT